VTPSPSRQHQQVVHRLVAALTPALPTELVATAGWSWKPGPDEFIPDVMVHPRTEESTRFTGSPVLLVEVLSSNRADDLVVKTGKYGRYGVPHYWIADPLEPSLAAFALTGGGLYRRVVHLSSGDIADLPFGPAVAHVDVDALFTD
jgi:Uma2 family endonuclease